MNANDVKRLDAISTALYRLLEGQNPDSLALSDEEDEINQVGEFVNGLILEQKAMFDHVLALSNGELSPEISSHLPAANGLKRIQAALRHLTWQTKQVANGDFGQGTDYWGKFSESFDGIITRLEKNQSALMAEIGERTRVEEKLRNANINMAKLIQERTRELSEANAALQNEIEDSKRVQKNLEENERKYRQLFNHAPAGIFEFDLINYRFISVNEVMCLYTGYSEEEFLSMNPLDLLTEESRDRFLRRFADLCRDKNKAGSAEYSILKKSGKEFSVLLTNEYIYKGGQLTGAWTVAHDITRLKKAEREKRDAQKIAGEQKKLALVGKIAGKMAHDFNNILSIIMGTAELSLIDCRTDDVRESLELILQQALRGKNLTKNLVVFAKDHEPKQEFFRINEKIDLVLNLLKKDLKGIKVMREDKIGLPDLLADPGMIEHALVNLIQNAVHALSKTESPELKIKTYCRYNHICFAIQDNGCGIPPEYHKSIYQPSFTLKGSRDITGYYKTGITGTGYGMSNIKKCIEQHKGDISFETKVGSGTEFIVRLPIFEKELTREEVSEIRKEITYSGKKILLVEDETDILNVQFRILSLPPCNHLVDMAKNGQDAMDLFDRNPYDFISLDYMLPGRLNGMDVYTHIRKTKKDIPVLFISGNIEFIESIEALKQKDDYIEHISKPCQNKDYVSRINLLLDRTQASPPDSPG